MNSKEARWLGYGMVFGWVVMLAACKQGGHQSKADPAPEVNEPKVREERQTGEVLEDTPPVTAQVVSLKQAPSKVWMELELKNDHPKDVEGYKCMILMLDR